jgi:recA bacterial DNA recombination protein
MASALKNALEDLLRARRLQAEAPPLRGEDRRLCPLPTGAAAVDALLQEGFPRGQLSEIHGPASSGRTGLALGLVARVTSGGALVAWVDPGDRFDPMSAAAASADLVRLLWLRGVGVGGGARALSDAVAAAATVVGSGLFEVVVVDLASFPGYDLRRLPTTTWIRLQRMVEGTPSALILLGDAHLAQGPAGISLALQPSGPRWSGGPGPGRHLRSLGASALVGRFASRSAAFELQAGD